MRQGFEAWNGNLGRISRRGSTSTRQRRSGALFLRLFLRLAEEELADELLQHDGRLGDRDAVARGERLVVAARLEPDVGFAEQPRGEDRGRGVLRELVA